MAALSVYGQKRFLKQYYPVFKGSADFFFEPFSGASFIRLAGDGAFYVARAWLSGAGTTITAGCTMDNQIAFDALHTTLLVSRILAVAKRRFSAEGDCQTASCRFGQYNQLQEWLVDADDPKDDHRHISHLYGLYPATKSPLTSPELFQAARIFYCNGEILPGWSIGWKINFWARMLDGNHAYRIIKNIC